MSVPMLGSMLYRVGAAEGNVQDRELNDERFERDECDDFLSETRVWSRMS